MPTTIPEELDCLPAPFYRLHSMTCISRPSPTTVVGAVIAREIHALDTNGASFDENGSLQGLMDESDYAAF